ncbi:MAG: S41 family peptidase [Bacteroidales bacterium]|nr:S41 family peptidase [Bacteroidales bacterium]MBN2698671.1 S41 family peptidase [Bacteroidales bacterium]
MKIKRDKIFPFLPIVLSLVLVAGIVLGNWFCSLRVRTVVSKEFNKQHFSIKPGINVGAGFSLNPKADKITTALQYILNEYVDTVSIDKINESVLPALVENLDPHSIYIPAEDFQKYNEPLTGNFSGIGVSFNMVDDTVAIINTIPNGPSEIVGILPGDRIIEVEDSTVAGVNMDSNDIVNMLKGEKGTIVRVKIVRWGVKEPLTFEITRGDIPIYSIDAAYMITDHIGYIKITQFAQTTFKEFMEAVEKLKAQGEKKLILDLRDNGGGIMETAIQISDQFLEEGQLIVYTEGKTRPRNNNYATSRGVLKNDAVVVLINEGTASASEIVAGALQDNDRGIIIGRRSFGKGLVQEQMQFKDGSALRLTVARYFTPTGRSIQKPYNNGREEYYHDLSLRLFRGELETRDSIQFSDSLRYVTPGGKIVYGGGGIMPDIFVPFDTTGITPYYTRVRSTGLIYRFAFFYTDLHRSELEKLKSPEQIASYLDNENILSDFVEFARSRDIEPDYAEINESKLVIETMIKAYIARNIIDNEGFYPIISAIDNTLKMAIDTLSAF